ncbi:MAG TPA: hypothetical protein VGQ22_03665 [Steroidobacteraceae bacterium]|jgi:hypothetical protein|nr:hypothetical protein [Steroidobacteraceae bacterium]
MPRFKTANQLKREQFKAEFWPDDIAWTGDPPEQGWFRAPRTLPFLLLLLSSKKITGSAADAGRVYLDLLARHRDSGLIEMANEGDHSYAAGYHGSRGVRTWKERMKLLEDLGFIKSRKGGNQQYKFVLLVHPTMAVHNLRNKSKIDTHWWESYRARQIEAKEPSYQELLERHKKPEDNVVPFSAAQA